jgi:hypothetical protein
MRHQNTVQHRSKESKKQNAKKETDRSQHILFACGVVVSLGTSVPHPGVTVELNKSGNVCTSSRSNS